MRPDEILDFSPSKNLSHFQEKYEKNKKKFNTFFWLSGLCGVCVLGITLKAPLHELDGTPYLTALFLLSFVGSITMLLATIFKFLATHHERNIATYQEKSYPFANNIFMVWVYFFASTLVFAFVISFIGKHLEQYIASFEWELSRSCVMIIILTTIVATSIFFYHIGLRGLYQWGLYLDHKIRIASHYDARINIILPRFLILLGVGLALIFDIFFNGFKILYISNQFTRTMEHSWRILTNFSFATLFISYLVYAAFSLFLWIHTIIRYKNQDTLNT